MSTITNERSAVVADVPATASRARRSWWRSVVVLIAMLLGLATAGAAQAAVIGNAGAVGVSGIGQANCSYRPAWGVLRMQVPAPTIYARNYYAGGGNDRQWVRYRVFIINSSTGATVQVSGYSGIALAADNSPAVFSGPSAFDVPWAGNYRADIRVEWLNGARTAVLGWTAHRFTQYRYFNGYNAGPFGPMSSCYAI